MHEKITSLQNPRVRNAIKLRGRRGRVKQGRIIIDGLREIQRAASTKLALVEAYLQDDRNRSTELHDAAKLLEQSGATVLDVSPRVFDKLAFGKRGEGIIAVAETPQPRLDGLQMPTNALIAVIEGIEKPGNVGAIIRSADAAGLNAVIVADGGTDLFNPNTIRASLGTVFTMPVCAATTAEVTTWLEQTHTNVLVARVDGAVPYNRVDYRGRTAIVLGSESDGVTKSWYSDSFQAVCIPMKGIADSLNVSATAAVLFYQAMQQRAASDHHGTQLAPGSSSS